jgi:hypothetical protein
LLIEEQFRKCVTYLFVEAPQTLAQYNASWATTRIVVLHIPTTAS